MDFIGRFEGLMKANSLSQKELAEKINIRRPLISEWKKNNSFPYADVAVKIAIILGVTVEYLIDGEAGAEYVRKIVKNDPKVTLVPDKIKDIVDNLLLLDDNELVGIRANSEALAEIKKGNKQEKPSA